MLQGAGDSRLPVLNNHSTISSLVAFKPRQVLLAEQQNRSKMPKTRVLEDDHNLALLHSVVKYFSTRVSKKTLKKIIKDSQVEDGAWEASVDLEEIYGKYFENSKNGNTSSKDLGEPGKKTNEDNKKDDETELKSKKEKKKNKKSKLTSESRDENGTEEVILPAVSEKQVVPKEVPDVAEIAADQNNSEPKEKKKKKKKVPLDNGAELVNKERSPDTMVNGTDDKSKKRKRSTSDDTEDKQVDVEATEDSKRRKTEAVNAQQTDVKTFGGESNADLKSPCPSSEKKTVKKQQNGSVEPKTVNAFQRVKPDAVKYADERLTDNSYWAKDGAETGYGAKAQEILGQVKGRDFRHEKTKKKRGSYRGGQIDLQSHSVKFNYSDEE